MQSTISVVDNKSTRTQCSMPTWPRIKQYLIKNFLVLGLLLALIIGLAWPLPGDTIGSWKAGGYSIVKTFNVCLIFFISGLTLKTSEIKAAVQAYAAFIYAIVVILIITPMAGFVTLEIPFDPQEFAIGLAVFCAVPTTLTSGATLVMTANGNYALALMITVCSNVLGVLTAPFALKLILEGVVEGVSINAVQLLIKLLLTILLPLIVGKVVRHTNQRILKFGKKHKVELSMVNNGSLIMVVWQTISKSQESIVNTRFTSILLLIVAGVVLHLVFLSFNSVIAKLVGWKKEEFRAVVILASQKTLPVSVTIISFFSSSVGVQGLIVLPCIIGHLSQLFMDSFIVARWTAIDAKNDPQAAQQEQSEKPECQLTDLEQLSVQDPQDEAEGNDEDKGNPVSVVKLDSLKRMHSLESEQEGRSSDEFSNAQFSDNV
eukprot:TRINITY_DN11966_c0_g1_i11.p1 TRINITY_DN11966_c0_g1~~TRINITY_DN11966_c0_g1_i11.p1  ORF type:complete len:432 (-),score=31.85 TRINITY_DN11966_c0_g1_i11:2800-4095(-)